MSNIINTGWTPPITDGEKARAIQARLLAILSPGVVERIARQCADRSVNPGDFIREFDCSARKVERFILELDNAVAVRREANILRAEAEDALRTREEAR